MQMSVAGCRWVNRLATTVLLGLLLTGPTPGQDERGVTLLARQQSPTAPDQQVFRTSATLVTGDAVVTDKTGQQVTDLTKGVARQWIDFDVRR